MAKKPVVTAALGGMPEWIQEEVTGLLFRPRDVADLRQTLRRFIADPSLVAQLSGHFPAVQSIAADAGAREGPYRKILDQITRNSYLRPFHPKRGGAKSKDEDIG